MDSIELVKAYFTALDTVNLDKVNQYLSDDYQLVDFTPQPMDKDRMLNIISLFKAALPNLAHSLSNIRVEGNVVKLTIQLSGTNSGHLDLRILGLGIIPSSHKFAIFPNGDWEITVINDKITMERDVSPSSPNRRMSGILRELGVNMAGI